jgi:hypothetical protein
MPSECDRTRLIAELASLLRECQMPDDARCAGLTLIGWLARRMDGEAASTDGVEHARRQIVAIVSETRRLPTAMAAETSSLRHAASASSKACAGNDVAPRSSRTKKHSAA